MKKIVSAFILFLIQGYSFCQVSLNEKITVNPSSVFLISNEIETDDAYKDLLSRYIYSCMIDKFSGFDQDSVNLLTHRRSFAQVITFIILDKTNGLNKFYESDEGWESMKMNLITDIPDTNVIYRIADSLLANTCNYGIMTLWDKCEFDRLSNYSHYKELIISKKDEYSIAELLALCCISGNKKEYANLSQSLIDVNLDLYNTISILCEKASFTYEDMMYYIYDGPESMDVLRE